MYILTAKEEIDQMIGIQMYVSDKTSSLSYVRKMRQFLHAADNTKINDTENKDNK